MQPREIKRAFLGRVQSVLGHGNYFMDTKVFFLARALFVTRFTASPRCRLSPFLKDMERRGVHTDGPLHREQTASTSLRNHLRMQRLG